MPSLPFDVPLLSPSKNFDIPILAEIGGKARGLAKLQAAALPVPPWTVIPISLAEKRPWRLDAEWRTELDRLFDTLSGDPFEGVVIRSSAIGEDEPKASFPGLFQSHHVLDLDSLADAIEQVYASVDSAAVRSYLDRRGIEQKPRMAVIVQSRVRSRVSGVAFSAQPARAKPDEIYVEMVEGFGNRLTEGSASPWSVSLDVASLQWNPRTANFQGEPALSPEFLTRLAEHVLAAEKAFGSALDVEWTWDGTTLWLVQARALSSVVASEESLPHCCGTSWFFDQRFSKPISPLTRTTLIPTILNVAVTETLVMRGERPPAPPNVYYWGQVYVVHEAYRRLFRGVPRWLLTPDLDQLFPARCTCREEESGWRRGLNFLETVPAIALMAVRHWKSIFLNVQQWRAFKLALPAMLSQAGGGTSDRESWLGRWDALTRLTEELLRLHRWSILLADIGYNLFTTLIYPVGKQGRLRLQRRLFESLQLPTSKANQELATHLQHRASRSSTPDDLVKRFGHRSSSIDHSEETWGEILSEGKLPDAFTSLEPAEADAKVLPKSRRAPPLWMRPLAALLEMREEQRFEWEKILAKQRSMIIEIATRLHESGILKSISDIWWLEWHEFLGVAFDGRAVPERQLRARQHEALVSRTIHKPLFIGPGPMATVTRSSAFRGLGASSGRVQGTALVIFPTTEITPSITPETILVMMSLDSAATILLSRVRAAVLERGGLLSHASMLAREYALPLVVGAEGVTKSVSTGMKITVDGDLGEVTIDSK
jgi:pyruvate,water dikinase